MAGSKKRKGTTDLSADPEEEIKRRCEERRRGKREFVCPELLDVKSKFQIFLSK